MPQAYAARPRQDSNLRSRLRRAVLYPLSYGGLLRAALVTARPAQVSKHRSPRITTRIG